MQTEHNKKVFFFGENLMLKTMHERSCERRFTNIMVNQVRETFSALFSSIKDLLAFDDDDESITIAFAYKRGESKVASLKFL